MSTSFSEEDLYRRVSEGRVLYAGMKELFESYSLPAEEDYDNHAPSHYGWQSFRCVSKSGAPCSLSWSLELPRTEADLNGPLADLIVRFSFGAVLEECEAMVLRVGIFLKGDM